MSYRFVDSFLAGPGWNCSSILVLLESCLQTCMTYTIAERTVNKLLMMDRGTVRETRRVSCQNKFVKLVHLVGFIVKKDAYLTHKYSTVSALHISTSLTAYFGRFTARSETHFYRIWITFVINHILVRFKFWCRAERTWRTWRRNM